MTVRLYHADSYVTEFEAAIVEVRPHGDSFGIVLDRTAFYPTSGGQPHDTGTLNDVRVVDVIEDGEDGVLHIVAHRVEGQVTGTIDWPRRLDHMQQHTGQHILSQAFLAAYKAQTRAVHLGADVSTLDLDLTELTADAAAHAEDLANRLVLDDRPVIIREVDESELAGLGLRRPAKKRGRIRVVEVEGFDRSACGGTHVRRTGEIGLIKIRRWERFKGGVRVEFLCGWRGVADYRWKNALVLDLAGRFSVKDQEVIEAVERQGAQLRERDRQITELRDRVIDLEAQRRLAEVRGTPRVVAEVIAGWTPEMISALAGRLIAATCTVAVLGTDDGRLVIARSADLDLDAASLLRRVVERLGGRGGGRPAYAQGAVPPAQIAAAVDAARSEAEDA